MVISCQRHKMPFTRNAIKWLKQLKWLKGIIKQDDKRCVQKKISAANASEKGFYNTLNKVEMA